MAALMKRRSGWARSLAPAISSVYPSTCACVSTAHINAHTSKVALLRKLPDGWIHNISCGFKWVLAHAVWSHRISPVIWDFSLLVVVIAAGLVNSEWWKLDHSLLNKHKLHSLMLLFHLQAVQVTEYPAPPPEKANGVSCGGNILNRHC